VRIARSGAPPQRHPTVRKGLLAGPTGAPLASYAIPRLRRVMTSSDRLGRAFRRIDGSHERVYAVASIEASIPPSVRPSRLRPRFRTWISDDPVRRTWTTRLSEP
jgi:hypothetical protein